MEMREWEERNRQWEERRKAKEAAQAKGEVTGAADLPPPPPMDPSMKAFLELERRLKEGR